MDEYTIIEDGNKFVVIDERGDPKFDSYWHQECRDWIDDQQTPDWDDEY